MNSPSPVFSRILVCIPAFNESRALSHTLSGLILKIKNNCEILVIDDGSEDETLSIASKHGVKTARLPVNLGYGAALQTGYKYAVRNQYDFLVQMDADGQHEPECIDDLLAPILDGKADLAIGNRFHDKCNYLSPFLRKCGRIFFSIIFKIFCGKSISDPTSGFRAMNSKTFKMLIDDDFPSDYPDVDVLIMLEKNNVRIVEKDVKMYPAAGKSMHSGFFHPFFYLFKMLLSIFIRLLRFALKEVK
ncbi:MAG: glycosyltransferase family 2 protein [Candidatus Riflebacteria bacterium]|nr:glycosyltransferase family 2 protein [Candidatus Riflebacteria bacterium]